MDRIDRETLQHDDELRVILQRIKEKVLSGHIVELNYQKPQVTGRSELDGLNTYSDRENGALIEHSFSKNIQGPITTMVQINQHNSSSQSEFTHQSFYSDEEPWNIEYITKQLMELENTLTAQSSSDIIRGATELFNQIRLLLSKNLQSRDILHKYTVLALRTLFLLGQASKVQGNFINSIKYFENCLSKFSINEPTFKGKLLIEIGQTCFIQQDYQKSHKYLYQALQHYEQMNWRLDIAYVLTLLARLNAWLKNPDTASKLCYESLAIYRDYLTEEDERIGDAYFILAELSYIKKDYDQAFQFAEQSISIKDQTQEPIKPQLCAVYNLLGILYSHSNDFKQAKLYFLKAFQCVKCESLRSSQILMNWSIMQAIECNPDLAQKGFQKAKQIQKKIDQSQTIKNQFNETLFFFIYFSLNFIKKMDDELAFQNLQNAIENMKRERDELLNEYSREKTDFQAFDAQIRKMQMELDLRVAILKDKETKLANYNKMIDETDLTYNRIVETSNRLATNLEKETQFIKDRFKRA